MVEVEQAQRLRVGRGRTAAKQRVVALVNERHAAARFGQDGAQGELADAVHGVHDHLEAGIADGLKIDELLDGVHVFVGQVARLTMPAFSATSSSSLMTSSAVSPLVSASIFLVSSSSSSEPSPWKTFRPFHSGGLWLAVKASP